MELREGASLLRPKQLLEYRTPAKTAVDAAMEDGGLTRSEKTPGSAGKLDGSVVASRMSRHVARVALQAEEATAALADARAAAAVAADQHQKDMLREQQRREDLEVIAGELSVKLKDAEGQYLDGEDQIRELRKRAELMGPGS
jgi:hypothetical protein